MHRSLLVALLALIAPLAAAQEASLDETTEPRSYTVEVIVFEYTEDVGTGSELFLGDRPAAEESDDLPDAASDTDAEFEEDGHQSELPTAPDVVPELRQLDLVLLRRDDFTMTETLERLQRLDAYQPIMHFGWTQPTYPPAETPAIQLRRFGNLPPGLDGSLKLYLSRFLHLVVDVALDARDDGMADGLSEQPVIEYGDARMQNDVVYLQTRGPVRYRIREDRIFKSGDIRYFDHPKFGLIAKITRIENDESGLAPAGSANSP